MIRKSFVLILLMMAPVGVPVVAQEWSAQPIEIDAATDTQGDGLLVVAAYRPDSAITPRIFGNTGAQRVALRAPDGSAIPSVILGRIEPGEEEKFGITSLLPQTVQEVNLRYDDLALRLEIKQSRPAFFRQLVEEGHVDPPDERSLKMALQTELKRMNCYRSGIDGAWGRGSRGSVSTYFEERGSVTWPDQDPTSSLFREIILNEDVRCETPVAAVVTRTTPRATNRTSTKRATKSRSTASKPAPRAKKPAAKASKPRISLDAGIGVFR